MKQAIKLILAILTINSCLTIKAQQNNQDKILGIYKVIGEESKELVKVKFSKSKNKYIAQIIWIEKPLTDNGEVKRDRYNPNPTLRTIPADKIVIAWDLTYDSKAKEWTGGKIYDPDSGKTYKATFKFENDNILKVRAYIGLPALGRTMNWKKIS